MSTSPSPRSARPVRVQSSSAQRALETLGGRLRDIRVDAGLTGRDLAAVAGWHSSKVSRIEHGRQAPSADDIRAWCRHCRAEDQVGDLLASARAVEGMFIEWRRMERTGLRVLQQSLWPLFDRTRHFHAYSSWLLPGLVQTREYTAAILRAILNRRGIPDDVDAAIEARMERQQILRDGTRRFLFLVEESVLRAGIGGPDVMAAQLGHLLVCACLPTVSLGIVPMRPDRDAAWPVEDFWMFDNELVAVELVSGYLRVTQPYDVALYAQAFTELADVAVFGSGARALITAAIDALDQ